MMFRTLSILASALVVTACQAGLTPHEAPAAAREPVSAAPASAASALPGLAPEKRTLVTMGASDVTGIGAEEPATEGWAPVLAGLLPGEEAHLKLGFPGWTAKQIRANVLATAVQAEPDVVVLWTGVNDFNAGVPLESFKSELEAMLAALAQTGATVYCLNLPDLDKLPAFKAKAGSIRSIVPLWRRTIEEVAEGHGARVIALTPYTDEIEANPDYISPDGFHPSTRGYRRLAEIVAAAVEPAWAI